MLPFFSLGVFLSLDCPSFTLKVVRLRGSSFGCGLEDSEARLPAWLSPPGQLSLGSRACQLQAGRAAH